MTAYSLVKRTVLRGPASQPNMFQRNEIRAFFNAA